MGPDISLMHLACSCFRHRSEIGCEPVRDVDVMPLDPFECLPLAMQNRPGVLNGRPPSLHGRGDTGAGNHHLAGTSTANLPQAAAAYASRGSSTGGIAAAGGMGGGPTGWGGSRLALDYDQARADQGLLRELAGVLDRKEALLSRLRALNAQAEGNGHINAATGRPEDDFQQEYAGVLQLLQVRGKGEVLLLLLSPGLKSPAVFPSEREALATIGAAEVFGVSVLAAGPHV